MSIEIGLLVSILGVILALGGYKITRDKSLKQDATETAEMKVSLRSIGAGVDAIRVDVKSTERQVTALAERQARTEEAVHAVEKRVDKIEEKIS
ncbi:hypothetical protein [Bacillus paranthracis]|uniref:hypothetical protein n=1 Tax=Bacillus paranthracis TaxID=2026186 RepID=UPI003D658FC1